MPLTDAPGKARALYEARQSRQQIEPFTDADPDLGMADGYAVQQELVKLLLADGDRIVGYKVGLTSKPMQKMIGVDTPDYGPVLGSTVYADGDSVPVSAFIQPKIEAEIAFVLGSPLAGPGVSVLDARRAIAGMTAAVEIVDSRFADWRIKLADTVADLASNGAVAISSRLVPLDGLDPRLIGMVLTRQGSLVDTGAGAAALGDPVRVVAWLANTLGEMGAKLEAGHLVMTGALHAAVPMRAGDVFRAEFDRLGPLTVRVVDLGGQEMSAAMTGTDEIAARLTKARADRTAIGSLSAELGDFDLASAYEVQRVLRREAGPLAGWKLGVTSRAKQAQVGVHEPVRGHLAAGDALDLGEPLVVAERIQPRCEPEIVFIMGSDLSGPSVTSSAVLAATADRLGSVELGCI